jgi:hypothetical protein
MKLLSIEIISRGFDGLQSDKLEFGDQITHLYGPNGSGKTPLIQAITFCLGYPSVFRDEIYSKCKEAILIFSVDKKIFSITRDISREVYIKLEDDKKKQHIFHNESDFSEYLFDVFKMPFRNLVGTKNTLSTPYMATVFPLFYLEQDIGYSELYASAAKFIKDQFHESIRLIFNLPAKNNFDQKKHKIIITERLEQLDKDVELQRRILDNSSKSIRNITKNRNEINNEINILGQEIERLKTQGADKETSINVIDRLIIKKKKNIIEIEDEISEIQKRSSNIDKIKNDINIEIESLNLNEEARRIFITFKEICGSENCSLFSKGSNAYTKSLLYLKDQIKDLDRNRDTDKIKSDFLETQKESLINDIHELSNQKNDNLKSSDINSIIETISRLSSQIFELNQFVTELDKHQAIEERFIYLENLRNQVLAEYESLNKIFSSSPEMVEIRRDLRDNFVNWLKILQTDNVSFNITYKEEFMPVLGNEVISQLKGSTKIRAILAYHAALIQTIPKHSKCKFNIYILDTPKQHEMHESDLHEYIAALKILSETNNMQIIFSTTEYKYPPKEGDKVWLPLYPGEKHNMYLKTLKINSETQQS